MSYYMKVTAIGLSKLTAATLPGGDPVSLTEIAVGDGNGNPVSPPTGSETALVREVYRDIINSLTVNVDDDTQMMAEMIIPTSEGGFAVHEIGIFDADGDMFAYGNFPATYKPTADDGSTREMIILAAIKVGNAELVQLVVDESITVATRPWVLATITAAFLIPGGTTGQLLAKASNADGDFEWVNAGESFTFLVDVVKEEQTAAPSQSIFTLATCTTTGLAVYVEGSREHQFTALSSTSVQMSRSLPSGTKVLFVQNEPNEPFNLRRLASSRAYFMGQF